jgi:hypothetical protein
METVRPNESGHGILGYSGDPANGTSGPIRVFTPTVCGINGMDPP